VRVVARTNKTWMRRSTTAISGGPVSTPERDPLLRAAAARPAGDIPLLAIISARIHHRLRRKPKELTVEAYGVLGSITGRQRARAEEPDPSAS